IIVGGIKLEGVEARRLVREAMRTARRDAGNRHVWFAVTASVVLLIVVVPFSMLVVSLLPAQWPPAWRTFVLLLVSVTAGAGVGRLILVRYLRANRGAILRAMRRRGYELCTTCGYWLKGLDDDVERCPECGAARESA
ncbi:MAG: hypothetical protein ACYTGV_19265, partial [Planctomycetota bacterium]